MKVLVYNKGAGIESVIDVKRTDTVRARVTAKEKKQIAEFAKSAKVTESDVVRYALVHAKVITKCE